ncbi:unnamed protein product [Wuchereria bancrofti]|uniref:Pepsin inhibitor-3-like repeated domain-containing protein n=1 Tax=Wuchereria bancrofti TaxID=6293 RepID=A0A3P7FLT8_WUCBA|nr:unnamed protein product [Wuchereria bancrofti]
MILSSTFYVVLVIVNAVIHTEGTSVSWSFSSFIIHFNNTICKVQDGVLSINNKVIGKLTEQQKEELEKFTNRTDQWSSQLHQRIQEFFGRVFGSVKSMWDNALNFRSELPQASMSDDVTTGNKLENQGDDDPSIFSVLDPPSFCKVN